ncbi:MAG: LacI family DNA-binding transcriptional regulator [Opitutaceae bacterium]|jgi:LacI family transcriptional regulator
MPAAINQRALAALTGVCQTTVSLALRGDPSIPVATREHIRRIADKAGYRPNPQVASLMAHIRRGRNRKTRDCIALLVDAAEPSGWLDLDFVRCQHDGMVARAAELGFRTEPFYLRAKGMTVARLDRILHARGIRALVLAGPRRSALELSALRWSDFACATISYTWDKPAVDRVSSHHRHNMDVVLGQLEARGYKRIGLSLQPHEVAAVDRNWLSGLLVMQQRLPVARRLPIFIGQHDPAGFPRFAAWFEKWRPDALVTLAGQEETWLRRLGLHSPADIGHACVNRADGTHVAGIEEDHALIGSTVIELLVAQIHRNEYGLTLRPRLTLINGEWHEGDTLRPEQAPSKSAARRTKTPIHADR